MAKDDDLPFLPTPSQGILHSAGQTATAIGLGLFFVWAIVAWTVVAPVLSAFFVLWNAVAAKTRTIPRISSEILIWTGFATALNLSVWFVLFYAFTKT